MLSGLAGTFVDVADVLVTARRKYWPAFGLLLTSATLPGPLTETIAGPGPVVTAVDEVLGAIDWPYEAPAHA